MEHAVNSLWPVILVLSAGIIGAALMKSIRLTPILGFFIAGIVIGPSATGLVNESELITLLAEVGVVLLMFDIGLHLSFRQMWRLRRELFILGPLQVGAAGAIIGLIGYCSNLSWEASIVVGSGLALSSTAIVMQLLKEKKLSNNPFGQTATSILVFQDILIVFLLILVPALGGDGKTSLAALMGFAILKMIGALITVYIIGKFLLQPLLAKVISFAQDELFTASVLLIIIITSSFTGYAGLSLPLGAFLAGLIISETTYCFMVKAEIAPFRTLLLGLFFISVGMTLDLTFLRGQWLEILGIVFGIMSIKVISLAIVALLQKRSLVTSIQLGLWLSQAGEFGFVLFGLAYGVNLFDQFVYQSLIVAIGVSFLFTPLMILLSEKISRNHNSIEESEILNTRSKVIIMGFGPEGKNLARFLNYASVEYIGIDPDPMRISTAKSQGFQVALGDPSKTNLYQSMNVSDALALVLTLDSDDNLSTYINRLSKRFPSLALFVNTHEEHSFESLKPLGVNKVILDAKENGVEISEAVLTFLGKNVEEVRAGVVGLISSD